MAPLPSLGLQPIKSSFTWHNSCHFARKLSSLNTRRVEIESPAQLKSKVTINNTTLTHSMSPALWSISLNDARKYFVVDFGFSKSRSW